MATIQAYAPPCEHAECHQRALWEVFDRTNASHGRFCREHAEFYLRELDLREHADQVRELLETGALPRLFTR